MPLSAWRKWWRRSTPRSKKLNKKHKFRKCFLEILEDRTLLSANLYTVNLTSDNVINTGQQTGQFSGDLRWCIEQADLNPNSTIQFDNSVFPLSTSTTIKLSQGELQVAASMTIQGEGSGVITVSGNDGKGGASRVFDITSSTATVTISGLTIANGNAAPNYTPLAGNQGGDIFNGGQLTLQNDIVTNGLSIGSIGGPNGKGGAIFNAEGAGTTVLTLDNTIVQSSTARGPNGGNGNSFYTTGPTALTGLAGGAGGPGQGGGIYNDVSALVIVEDGGQIIGNTALGGNGGNGGAGVTIGAKGAPGGTGGRGGDGGLAEGGAIYNAGNLELNGTNATSIVLADNTAQGGQGGQGANGGTGQNGAAGGNGGNSGGGGNGGLADGGGIFNTGTVAFPSKITLQYVNFLGDQAIGGGSNKAGLAGNAGSGSKTVGGTGGKGGPGGFGGNAQGGGIYTGWGPLTVPNTLFGLDANGVGEQALGGSGGPGGAGGNGGNSSQSFAGPGNPGGPGGAGGAGGKAGFAKGGAVANVTPNGGSVAFTNTIFDTSVAKGGNGGAGGNGGTGGAGVKANEGSTKTPYSAGIGGLGGPGGNAGAGGAAVGGGVFNAIGTLSITNSTLLSNQALAGSGGAAGAGGLGGIGGARTSKSFLSSTSRHGGTGGAGGVGGVGGNAQGGGFYNLLGAVTVLDSTFKAKSAGGIGCEASGGSGGAGGNGGKGGQGGDNGSSKGSVVAGAGGDGGVAGAAGNAGLAEGGAGGNQGGNTSLTGDIFSSSLVQMGTGGTGGNGGTGGDGGDASVGHGADAIGGSGGNASDGGGFTGPGFGGAFADTAGNLTVSSSTFTGSQVVGGAGGAGGIGGGWGHWGHRGGASSYAAYSPSGPPHAGNGGHGGLGAFVYGGSLSVSGNAQTLQISNTTFTNSAITSGAGGNGGQAGLFSHDGAFKGINGPGGNAGLAQGGAVSVSASAAQSATLSNVTIASSSATGGLGGAGAINFLGSVTTYFVPFNGFGSVGGNGGSVQGLGLADVNYNLTINGPSSFNGGVGQAGMGGTGGGESVPEPRTWAGGAGGNGGNMLGGGIFFSNNTSGTLNFSFNNGSASSNRLNGGVGGNGGFAGASGHSDITGGAGGNGGRAQGGGIYILAGANAINATTLGSLLLDNNVLVGGTGGVGGAGFDAAGGIGGDANGGGLFNSSSNTTTNSTLSVTGSTFAANQLTSGIGGDAGSGTTPNGGAGGAGGNAGNAEGGGMFDGTHTSLTVVNSTFSGGSTNPTTPLANANILLGSRGGRGGDAGTPTGVAKNDGGAGGNGGSVEGANVFVGGGTSNFINDTIVFGQATSVGLGGAGGSGAGKGGANGAAGANGVGFAGGYYATAGSTDKIGNTIIDLNNANVVPSVSPDVSGSFTSLGNNILGRAATSNGFTGSGDQINVAAAALNMGPLLPNGGPTLTDALLNNGTKSAAIDAGGNALVTNAANPWFNQFGPNPTDQRGPGFPRIFNNTVDIGAFEFSPPVITNLNPPSQPEQGLPFVLTITGTGFATGATVSFGGTTLVPSSVSLTQIQVTVPTSLLPDEGTANVTVSVPDGSGVPGETLTSNTVVFNITDGTSITLSNPGNQNNSEGDQVSLSPITSSDPDTTFAATGLPTGLSINGNTGVISGTIDVRAAGSYTVTVNGIDTDTNTVQGSVTFTWNVVDSTPPDIVAPPTQNNNEKDVLSAANNNTVTVSVTDADPGTITDVLNGKHTLPPGLTIDPTTGVISGTIDPRGAGTYNVSITASDNGNFPQNPATFTWIVADTTPPVVTAPSNQTSNEGQTITPLKLNAVDADSFTITGLPGGLTYNSTTGTISGTINQYADGSYTVTITATDNGYQSTPVSFSWTVNDTTPPSFTNPGKLNNNEGDSVSIKTNPVDADATSIQAINLPKGLSIDPTTGVISGTIDPRAAGSYTVTVSATDGAGNTGSTTFTWNVADTTPPVVVNPGNQTSNEGQTIPTLNITATDADSFNITGLPTGLTYNTTTGAISGTVGAYAASTYTVTITATDNPNIQSTPVSFTWTVNDTTPPAITNPGNQSTNEGVTITPLAIQATDAESFTITGLPPGLTFDANKGIISGTVDSRGAGTYTVMVTAFDGALSSSTQFTWTINDTTPPAINNPGTRNNNEGDSVNLAVGSTDADPGSFAATGLPTGLSINATTGAITGTIDPRAAGTYTVMVSATDGATNIGSTTFTWNVADTTAPSITTPLPQSNNEGDPVNLAIKAVDADTFSATGLPTGLSIDTTTGVISGNIGLSAGDSSPYTVTVFASDNGNTSSVSFNWTVADTTPPSFTNPGDQINNEGDAVSIATNPVGADPGTIKATGLPPGLSVNSTTGVIAGTIDPRAGAYAVTISGSDNGNSASISLVWRVNDTTPPLLGSPGTQNTNNGTFVALAIPANDADAGTFTASGLPAGLSINSNTGVIAGKLLAQAGTYNVTVTASDGGQASSVSFAWVVNQLPISVSITNLHNTYAGPFQIETVTAQVTDPSGITINSGTVVFHVNGETLSAPVINGFATVTFVTPMVEFDLTILLNDFFAHNLDAAFSDPSGLFGTAGATVSEPAMLLDFVLFLQASQFGSLASQLAQLQQNQ